MSGVIHGRSGRQVRGYRIVKLALGLAAAPFAAAGVDWTPEAPKPPAPMSPLPIVTTDDAMRENFPVRWGTVVKGGKGGKDGKAPLLKVGKHALFGTGPANSVATLYEGDKPLVKARLDARGKWKAQIRVTEPGVKVLRAEFWRGRVAAGRSAILRATFVDGGRHGGKRHGGDPRNGTEVRITNLAPNDRVIAGAFQLKGIAAPGDPVQIYVDATLLGKAEAGTDGRWTFRPKLNGGGRRTFTAVDMVTEAQFGPLPVFVVPPPKTIVVKAAP